MTTNTHFFRSQFIEVSLLVVIKNKLILMALYVIRQTFSYNLKNIKKNKSNLEIQHHMEI